MGWQPCCCDTCVTLDDNFDRGDDTDLGLNWVEESGDWKIDGNRLKMATVASDKWVRTADFNDADWAVVEAVVRSSAAGDQLRLGIHDAATIPNTPAVYCELTVGGAGTAKLRLKAGATVRAECDVTAAINTEHTLKFCVGLSDVTFEHAAHVNDYFLVAWLNGVRVLSGWNAVPALSEPYGWCGVGTVTGVPEFDDFTLTASKDRSLKPNCPQCAHCCWPHTAELPDQVQIVVAGMIGGGFGECSAGECTALNGTYVLDRAARPADHDDVCAYYELTISKACAGGTFTKLRFYIQSHLSDDGDPNPGCQLQVEFDDGFLQFIQAFASSDPAHPAYVAGEMCGSNTPTMTATGALACHGGTYTVTPL